MEEKNDKKNEIPKEKKKISFKKSGKYIYAVVGVFLIILVTLLILLASGYLAIKYSTPIQEYLANFLDKDSTILEERKVVITTEESAVINIVEQASPSVVSIAISKLTLSQDQGLIDQSSNIGTGFVVDKDGVIITNQHVVSDLTAEYKVVTQDGKEYSVDEVLRDDLNDVALIKIDPESDELKE